MSEIEDAKKETEREIFRKLEAHAKAAKQDGVILQVAPVDHPILPPRGQLRISKARQNYFLCREEDAEAFAKEFNAQKMDCVVLRSREPTPDNPSEIAETWYSIPR